MLAFARRMNHQHHLTKANTTSSSAGGPNDEHPSSSATTSSVVNTDKLLLMNSGLSQEPTTPCVLNTPNTCTKNSTFFYEIPVPMHHTILSGEKSFGFSFIE